MLTHHVTRLKMAGVSYRIRDSPGFSRLQTLPKEDQGCIIGSRCIDKLDMPLLTSETRCLRRAIEMSACIERLQTDRG